MIIGIIQKTHDKLNKPERCMEAVGGNPATYLDNLQVQKAMRSMKARHVLLISDSCYSGTLFGKARSLPRVIDDKYYLSLYNNKSRWGMTSGNKTPVSDQGTGGHSVFAYQLIKELEKSDKPFLSTQEIYTRIVPVIANNSEQTPLCRPILHTGDQGGEFVFVASIKKAPPSTILTAKQGTLDKEMLFWQSIQNSTDPALFEMYLERFPNGFFAPIAKRKIEALKQKKLIASIPVESSKSKLFVEVEPSTARVRILNIKPKFQQGMELSLGRYHVEVSAKGFKTEKRWVPLSAGGDETITIHLAAIVYEPPTSSEQSPKRQKEKGELARYQKAAEAGHAQTQNNLGDLYYYGRGVKKDYQEALKWYGKAAAQGNKSAIAALDRLK